MRTYPNSFSQFHFTKVKKVSIHCFKGKSEFKESFSTWNKVLNRTETPKDSQGISAWRLRLFPRQQTFHLHSLSQFPESGASVFDPIFAGFLAPQDPAPSHFLIPVYRQYLFHIQPAHVTHTNLSKPAVGLVAISKQAPAIQNQVPAPTLIIVMEKLQWKAIESMNSERHDNRGFWEARKMNSSSANSL